VPTATAQIVHHAQDGYLLDIDGVTLAGDELCQTTGGSADVEAVRAPRVVGRGVFVQQGDRLFSIHCLTHGQGRDIALRSDPARW